jgi:hypothetical protein
MRTNQQKIARYLNGGLSKTAGEFSVSRGPLTISGKVQPSPDAIHSVNGWPLLAAGDEMQTDIADDSLQAMMDSPGMGDMLGHPFRNTFSGDRRRANMANAIEAGVDELPFSGQYATAGAAGVGGTAALLTALLSKDHKLRNAVIAGLLGAAAGGAAGYGVGEYAKDDIAGEATAKLRAK